MTKRRESISKESKEKITAKLFTTNCLISELSRSYGISRSTLYKWRSRARNKKTLALTGQGVQERFIELSVQEGSNFLKKTRLQKALLTFEDFSISMEGSVSSSKFISILKILEEPC